MKQEIEQIRSAYSEDNPIPAKVESALKKIEKAHETFETQIKDLKEDIEKKETSISDLYKESKKRHTKVLELEREMEKITIEKEQILADTKHEDYNELKKYKEDNEKLLAGKKAETRKQFIEKHEKIKDHVDYEKLKDKIKLPEEGKDWTSLDDDTMVANAKKLEEYEGLGFFGTGKGAPGDPKPGGGKTNGPFNPFEKQFKK